jgi:hypothetical protein
MKKIGLLLYLIIYLTKVGKSEEGVSNTLESSCSEELVINYRLYPFENSEIKHENYICPYIKNDCCAFSSQKLIQILWAKLSNPRIQRVLTRNLHHIEVIIKNIQAVLALYENNELPPSEKYSAECLTSLEDMKEFVDGKLHDKLTQMFEDIKLKFSLLYEFKKQFFCHICDQAMHPFLRLFDKQTVYSFQFCNNFSVDFKDVAWFLNYEIIKYFETVRKYIYCYKEKNFLLVEDVQKFEYKRRELKAVSDCRDNDDCQIFCQYYSIGGLHHIFIGDIVDLKKMSTFLEDNKADNRGFIEKIDDKDKVFSEKPDISKIDFFQEDGPAGIKKDIEDIQLDFYEHTYKMYRKKEIKKKMNFIKSKVKEEFEDKLLYQYFIPINDSSVDLDEFQLILREEGINPYLNWENVDMYIINANLTLYDNPVSNAVADLLDLNKTNIVDKMFNTGKLMKEDGNEKDIRDYIQSKVFRKSEESKFFMIENPYVDISRYKAGVGVIGWLIWCLILIFY